MSTLSYFTFLLPSRLQNHLQMMIRICQSFPFFSFCLPSHFESTLIKILSMALKTELPNSAGVDFRRQILTSKVDSRTGGVPSL